MNNLVIDNFIPTSWTFLYFQYLAIVCFLNTLVGINCLLVYGLSIVAAIQLGAWKIRLINNHCYDMVHQMQYTQMTRYLYIYMFATIIILFVFMIFNMGFRTLIKQIIKMSWWRRIVYFICHFILLIIFIKKICLAENEQTIYHEIIALITINTDPLSIFPEDQYLILTYPKALLSLRYISLVFNAEHLIIIFLLIQYRPSNYDRYIDELENE